MCQYCTNNHAKIAIVSGKYLGLSLSENKPNAYIWGHDNKGGCE